MVDYPIELVGIDSPIEFNKFLKLGETHTKPLLYKVISGRDEYALSVKDALSIAYLHGVWHGYQVAEICGTPLRDELSQQKLASRILE